MAKSRAISSSRRAGTLNQPDRPGEAETKQPETDPFTWVREHQRLLSIALVAVAAVVGVTWLTIATGQRKEAAGQLALDQARNAFDAYDLPAAAAAFQQVIQTYGGTRAAKEANLALNQVRIINGQNELAIVSLRDFLASGPGAVYQAPGFAILGAALENVNRPEEAGQAFLDASESASVEYLKAQYLLDAGRAFAGAGAIEQAIDAYRAVLEDYSETTSVTEATVRLSELRPGSYSESPELEG